MNRSMKNWFIRQSLDHPKRAIGIPLILSLILFAGMSGNVLSAVQWLAGWLLPAESVEKIFPRSYEKLAERLPHFVIDEDMMKLLPQTTHARVEWETVRDEFGRTDLAFIAFGHRGESVFNDSLLASLWDVSRALEVLPEVDEVTSLSTMNRMDSFEGFLEITPLQPSRVLTAEEVRAIETYLDKVPNLKKRVLGRHGDFVNVMIRPRTEVDNNLVREDMLRIADDVLGGYEVHFGGTPYLFGTIPSLILEDVVILMVIGVVILLTVLAANLRYGLAVKLVWSVIVISLLSMMGFLGWMATLTGSEEFHFSMVNTSMPIILLTIASADGVHILTKFFREFRTRKDVREATRMTMESLLLPVFLTSLTTVIAFLSMIFAPIEQFTGYGVTISFGIAWAWLLSSLFLPAMIARHKWDLASRAVAKAGLLERVVAVYGRNFIRFRKVILTLGLTTVSVAAVGILLVKVEVNFTEFFRPGSEIRKSIDFMNNEMTGVMDLDVRVEGDMKSPDVLRKVEAIQDFIGSHPRVYTTISIVDVIKQMHRTVMDDDPAYETIPDDRGKVNNLFTLYSISGDPEDFSSLVDYDYRTGLVTALMNNVTTSMIVEFMDNTQAMIEPLVEGDMKTTITGLVVVMRELVDLVLRSAIISITVSLFMIFLISWIFFRRRLWGLLSVIPLTSAVILNFGLMGLFGVELSHVTAVLSSIIIGVGVDFALHYIAQYRNLSNRGISPDRITREVVEEVGYPILLNVALNMGFASLLFSMFVPMQYIGGLIIFAMVSTSVGTLTLLASLAEMLKLRLVEKGGTNP
ncbi:MAG: RND family transporter [Fidelibacterota bacterium]